MSTGAGRRERDGPGDEQLCERGRLVGHPSLCLEEGCRCACDRVLRTWTRWLVDLRSKRRGRGLLEGLLCLFIYIHILIVIVYIYININSLYLPYFALRLPLLPTHSLNTSNNNNTSKTISTTQYLLDSHLDQGRQQQHHQQALQGLEGLGLTNRLSLNHHYAARPNPLYP